MSKNFPINSNMNQRFSIIKAVACHRLRESAKVSFQFILIYPLNDIVDSSINRRAFPQGIAAEAKSQKVT